jgi:hypothetical protein
MDLQFPPQKSSAEKSGRLSKSVVRLQHSTEWILMKHGFLCESAGHQYPGLSLLCQKIYLTLSYYINLSLHILTMPKK